MTLSGISTFSGPVSIDSGSLRVGGAGSGALGDATGGTTVHAGATLIIASSNPLAEPMTLAGGAVSIEGNGANLTGPITLSADTVVSMTPSAVMSINGTITGGAGLTATGGGTMYVTAASPGFTGTLTVPAGQVIVDGSVANATIDVSGTGLLGGAGTTGPVHATSGSINPGPPSTTLAAKLITGNLTLNSAATLAIDLNGELGGGYDRLQVNGTVNLGNATLQPALRFTPTPNSVFILIDNDGSEPIVGTFNGLPEGATLTLNSVPFVISYVGGTGLNDVTLTAYPKPVYYLSEGSTGPFFDTDILIANPNDTVVFATISYLLPDGQVRTDINGGLRGFAAKSRETIHVDAIPGMEGTAFSTTVSPVWGAPPLIVERSMFWDDSYYAGHTGSAVETAIAGLGLRRRVSRLLQHLHPAAERQHRAGGRDAHFPARVGYAGRQDLYGWCPLPLHRRLRHDPRDRQPLVRHHRARGAADHCGTLDVLRHHADAALERWTRIRGRLRRRRSPGSLPKARPAASSIPSCC